MYLQATFSMEIVESARLDGAKEFRIFNQIILPMLKPAIATQTIFAFVGNWTNSYVPRIILIEASSRTLPIIGGVTLWYSYASFIPPILVYAFCSKHIVEGVALGSVKN
jgi:multiple sugar transport system permease protein